MTGAERFAGVVIVAAGRGERFGDSGKVLAEAAGKPLLCWSIEAALAAGVVSEIVVVAGPHSQTGIDEVLTRHFPGEPIAVCMGGERRQDSVLVGIVALSASVEVAIIHDAARPLALPAMFEAVANAARSSGAAITGVPVTDTLKEVDQGVIGRTIDRSSLWAAQTPQAFRLLLLKQAFAEAESVVQVFTDEAALLESIGHPVTMVEGGRENLKVTAPEDLAMVDFLLSTRSQGESKGEPHVSS